MRRTTLLYPLVLVVALALISVTGCSESDSPVTLRIASWAQVSGVDLTGDAMIYENAAGQAYSVSKLEYYLSDFVLIRDDGALIELGGVLYVDALDPEAAFITLRNVKSGTYKGLRCVIGLAGIMNERGQLENTVENVNMYWPLELGGGYHYMKLEGRFASGDSSLAHATHTGRVKGPGPDEKTEYYVVASVGFPETEFVSGASYDLDLLMDVNEWFVNPVVYAFPDTAFIMGNHERQAALQQNGITVMSVDGPRTLSLAPEGGTLIP